MEDIESAGKIIDTIDVTISYEIIELFSAGLYSSPNKAFEELVCNSYDAFADQVSVFISPDLTVNNAYIWVCDNGESMDHDGLKQLWRIGSSAKRTTDRDERRLQIGRFGIGKLATYILANKLTYICKKHGRYLKVTMNYQDISQSTERLTLSEKEVDEKTAEEMLGPLLESHGRKLTSFELFGDNSPESWTFTLLSGLKPKATEISEGRLKWVLRTALPLSPSFKLHFNGSILESSKISRPIVKKWILGKDDETAKTINNITINENGVNYSLDFESLKNVRGEIVLYEQSFLDGSKSSDMGRSHGIFLMVRGRLVNLDDPLLGLDVLSHGPFNRVRIVIHADELDANLTSTRESIKESAPLKQLQNYIKSKFNREVTRTYFDFEQKKSEIDNIPYRLAQTSLTASKRPLYIFAEKCFQDEIINPILIKKPNMQAKERLLNDLKLELENDQSIIKDVIWETLDASEPIAKLDLETGILVINLLHPYIANYNDAYKSKLPLQFIAIAEVLTEAHLYEVGIEESIINNIIRRRDSTLRALSLSDRRGAVVIAQVLKDSLADSVGLEDAVHNAFLSLGFESTKIGGKGKPDGKATAILGFNENNKSENYSLTFDAKSTAKRRIQANTTHLATINKHRIDYSADFAIVVARDFEGGYDESSNVSLMAKQQRVTLITTNDLIRLLLLYAPKQVGLRKIRTLFETCYSPSQVSRWIRDIQAEKVDIGPIQMLLETIYDLQKTDTEPPEIAGIRQKLNSKLPPEQGISKDKIRSIIESLKVFVPGFVSAEGERVGIQGTPEKIMNVIASQINDVPNELQKLYLDAFNIQS